MLANVGTRLARRGNTFRCSSASSSLTPAAVSLSQKGFSTQIVEMKVKSNRTGQIRDVSFFVVGIHDRQLTGKNSAEETLKALQVAQKAEVMTGVFPCLEEFYVDKMLDVASKEKLQSTQKILPASSIRSIKRCGYIPSVQAAVAGRHNLVPIGQGSWERFDRGCNALFRNPWEVVQFYKGILTGDWLRYFSWGDEEPDEHDLADWQETSPHFYRAVIEEPAQYSALRAMLEAHYALHRKPDVVTASAVIICNNKFYPAIVDALETFSGIAGDDPAMDEMCRKMSNFQNNWMILALVFVYFCLPMYGLSSVYMMWHRKYVSPKWSRFTAIPSTVQDNPEDWEIKNKGGRFFGQWQDAARD